MKSKTFSNGLVVKHCKSAIILEHEFRKTEQEDYFRYFFNDAEFAAFADYIEAVANDAWANVTPKPSKSANSDYDEDYDRTYGKTGNLFINDFGISIRALYGSVDKLYQFNKPNVESFLYDLRKHLANK